MKKLLKRIFPALLAIGVLFCFSPIHADFGDYSGDSDYGGSSSSDSGSYSSYSSDSDYSYYSSSGSDGIGFGDLIMDVAIVAIVAIIFIIYNNRNGGNRPGNGSGSAPKSVKESRDIEPISSYGNLDENFSQADLEEKISNLYVQMQQCWTDKNIESLRPYLSDAFYEQMDRQLDTYRKKGWTNYVERIAVLSVNLEGFYQSGGNDVIVAQVEARIVDYTLDDATDEVVKGDKNKEKFMTYEWELERPTGHTTTKSGEMTVVNCPNCGAPLSINKSAKCPYCGSVVTLKEHNFVISKIRGLAQRTGR